MNTELFLSKKNCIISTNYKWLGKPEKIDGVLYYEGVRVNLGYNFENVNLSPDDLFEMLSVLGLPTCCCLKDQHRCRDNFVSHSVALVDIDESMRIEDLETNAFYQEFGFAYYSTPSHAEKHHRFRIIFILENDITVASDMVDLYNGLIKTFTSSDESCKDAARLFYGTINAARKGKNNKLLTQSKIDELIELGKPIVQSRSITDSKSIDHSGKIYEPFVASFFDREEVLERLEFIKRDCDYHTRRDVSVQVFRILGTDGFSVLKDHFIHSEPETLNKQLHDFYNLSLNTHPSHPLGALTNIVKPFGFKKTRLSNKRTTERKKIDYVFPELVKEANIQKVLSDALAEQNELVYLVRSSTGSGKTREIAELIAAQPKSDSFLIVTDTHKNMDAIVDKINANMRRLNDVTNGLLDSDTPFEMLKKNNPPAFNKNVSRAVALKGRNRMCNNHVVKEKYGTAIIDSKECGDCYVRKDGGCNYYNQITSLGDPFSPTNVFVFHINNLYLPVSKLFREFDGRLFSGEEQYHISPPNFKAVIVDENAIRTLDNGIERCVIPSDLNYDDSQFDDEDTEIIFQEETQGDHGDNVKPTKIKKQKLTKHPFLLAAFRRAYNLNEDVQFTKAELKSFGCIYGDRLKVLLDETKKTYSGDDLAISVKKNANDNYNKVDLFKNIQEYFKTGKEQCLFGMRLEKGCFIQGKVERLESRYLDKKIIFFDATMNPAIVRDVLVTDRPLKKIEIDVQMSDKVKIYQTIGESFSKSFLRNPLNILHVVNYTKKFINNHNLNGKFGGLITFKSLTLADDTVIDDFPAYLACQIWGDEYHTNNKHQYFGNTRGSNELSDCDYMLLIGTYRIPRSALESFYWNLYNKKPCFTMDRNVEHYNRMADGSCIVTKIKKYQDEGLQAVYEHLVLSENEQALGRARIINDKPKTILVYSDIPLGGNIAITDFILAEDVIPNRIISDFTINFIKNIGFIKNKRSELCEKLDFTGQQYKDNKDTIIKELLDAGGVLTKFSYKTEQRKVKTDDYFVFDSAKFDDFKNHYKLH